MSRWEILHTRLGEMMEMMDCYAIAHGAEPKHSAQMSYDDAMKVR